MVLISVTLLFLSANKVVVNELALLWETEYSESAIKPRTAVILGGFSKYDEARNAISITEAGERLYKGFELFESHAIDTIIISGGAAAITGEVKPESIYAKAYLIKLGIPSENIFIDTLSRNTSENAIETKRILESIKDPQRAVWLISSSFHLRRAMKTFNKNHVRAVAMPVQYFSDPKRNYSFADFLMPSSEALYHFDAITKEITGTLVYGITGKL